MKKSQLSVMSAIGESKVARFGVTSASAVMAMAAIVGSTNANAANCTSGSSTGAAVCTIAPTSGFIVTTLNFTGSNNVTLDAIDNSGSGFGACGTNQLGTGNSFGLTTNGGSMQVKTATATAAPTATSTQGGGCV
ncbi:MAG: hypothetical protein JO218_00390 [Burkholderiales bacterium]|nr:hypothetical protein [Burkholderiales bacterium]